MLTKDAETNRPANGTRYDTPDRHIFTKLCSGIVFGDAVEYDTLIYTCNIETSEEIFRNGLSLTLTDDYIWLIEELGVEIDGILGLNPGKSSDNTTNPVKFFCSGLNFLALCKFYFTEILDYGDMSVLRILVTQKAYPELKKFNPFLETKAPAKTGTLPIVFFKGKWMQYTTFSSMNGSKAVLKVEFLLDKIPSGNVICCDLVNKELLSLMNIFKFFAYLSKYHGSNGIVYRSDKTSLYKLISAIRKCHCDTGEVQTLPFMERIDCINKALFSINFGKAFDTGVVQPEDIKHVNAMDLIYLKKETVPYPQTIINVMMKGMLEMENKEKSFQDVFAIFSQHFLTQEAKLTVKSDLIAYLCNL